MLEEEIRKFKWGYETGSRLVMATFDKNKFERDVMLTRYNAYDKKKDLWEGLGLLAAFSNGVIMNPYKTYKGIRRNLENSKNKR
ncbi:MAG: hypothetical protein AABW88_00335 [Nanoarchaeota archaeon]